MAAGEDQPKALVRDLVHVISQALQRPELLSLSGLDCSHPLASQPINRPVAGRGDDPCRRIVGDTAHRPGAERLFEGVLDSLFSQVEAAGGPDQRRDRPSRLAAEQEVDVPACLVRASALRLSWELLDRAQLDGAVHRARTTASRFDRLVNIGDIE
jgi:hypothetical protein